MDGEAALEDIELENPQCGSVLEKDIGNNSTPPAVRGSLHLDPNLLQLSLGCVHSKVREDLVQHWSRCTDLDFLDALHVGEKGYQCLMCWTTPSSVYLVSDQEWCVARPLQKQLSKTPTVDGNDGP